MAKDEGKEAVLTEEITSCILRYDENINTWELQYDPQTFVTAGPTSSGWTQPGAGAGFSILWEGTIDLAGLNAQEKTLFTTGATMQQSGPIRGTQINPPPPYTPIDYRFYERVIVSDVPITDPNNFGPIDGETGPGFLGSGIDTDWEQIIYARHRVLTIPQKVTPVINPGAPQEWQIVNTFNAVVLNEETYGSGSPTAGNKLYVYKRVDLFSGPFNPGTNAEIKIPSSRFVLGGFTAKEGDLSHLMRMRRSLEQQVRTD